MSGYLIDQDALRAMAARAARGLPPVAQGDKRVAEGRCRRCEEELDETAMDGCCGSCARELRRSGEWSTRHLF